MSFYVSLKMGHWLPLMELNPIGVEGGSSGNRDFALAIQEFPMRSSAYSLRIITLFTRILPVFTRKPIPSKRGYLKNMLRGRGTFIKQSLNFHRDKVGGR
jgi:hypothetical protein